MIGLIKRLVKLILAMVVVAIVAVVLAIVYIDSLAKAGVEIGGKQALGVETKVESVSIGLLSGTASLENLSMAEPPGFKAPHFMKLEKGYVRVSLTSLRSDLVEVPRLELTGIDIYMEKNDEGQANYDIIFGNQKKQETQPKTEEAEEGKKFIIEEIIIRNVTVHADVLPVGKPLLVEVPEIILNDIGTGGENGVGMAEVVNIVLKAIWASAIANGKQVLPDDVLNGMSTGLGGLKSLSDSGVTVAGDMGVKIADISKDAAAKAKEAAEKLGKGVKGRIDGLLSGKDE